MKKISHITLLVFVFMLMFSGCVTIDNSNNEVVSDNSFYTEQIGEEIILTTFASTEGYETARPILSYSAGEFFESSAGMYYHNHFDYDVSIIEYAESALGPWVPLCGKPQCNHNDKNCNAYISGNMLGMYDGRLYYVNDLSIGSMALDGSDHSYEFDIPSKYFEGDHGVALSDGYIYCSDVSFDKDQARFFRISIDVDSVSDDDIDYVISEDYFFRGYRYKREYENGVIISTTEYKNDERMSVDYLYSFKTNEMISFLQSEMSAFYITSEYVYCRPQWEIYIYDFDSGETELLFTLDKSLGRRYAVFCDGVYFYAEQIGAIEEGEPPRQFFVYDMHGNLIGQTDMDIERGSCGDYQMIYTSTKDAVLFTKSGPNIDYIILKSDIATGEFKFIEIEHSGK